jgi:hypothetical protein
MAITKKGFIFFARTGSHEGQAPIAVPASGAMSAIGIIADFGLALALNRAAAARRAGLINIKAPKTA